MAQQHDNDVSGRKGVREPIAITGIGCRLPGASHPEEFWKVLRDGIDAVTEYPGNRFPYIDRVYRGNDPAGSIATTSGGFLRGIDAFDPAFFGISPREASYVDPQHRLFLETAWEAIEDAGIVRESLAGSATGVFVGMWLNDYELCLRDGPPDAEFHATVGTGRYSIAGRLSYFLDLRGPSLTLDTACSSSLVAIHLASQSIWSGESEMALAGGANLILRPEITLAYSRAGMLSPRGRCRFGDAEADGYVRSEGAAVIVLKPLARALADGDRVYATIRGSAVNNDGQSSGLLVSPSRLAQSRLIASALRNANVSTEDVDYIEAHGTGTLAGDPVELDGITQALSPRSRKVLAGSVKTNIGHTEGTAGVAGTIKVALALHHGLIPPSLNYTSPNPRVDWSTVEIASEPRPWTRRLAGVSGFGITGTNAHVVLEGVEPPVRKRAAEPPAHLLTISAHTENALRRHAESWKEFLAETEHPLTSIAYTASRRRTHQEFRLAVTGSDVTDLAGRLDAWTSGSEAAGLVSGRTLNTSHWKTAFVFSGAGGQWLGMGRSLLSSEPVFRDAMEACDAAVRRQGGPGVLDEINALLEASRLNEFDVLQPVLWAVQVSLARLWRSWGVEPSAVIGHSMGEAAAAEVCGALSLDEAAAVICLRSRLSCAVAGRGRMAVAGIDADSLAAILAPYADKVSVAGVNGAASTILSGDAATVELLLDELNRREIFCRRVNVNLASHSPHMDEVRPHLEAALPDLRPSASRIPMYSTVTGAIENGESLDAAYWGKNLRNPVLFWPALRRMIADGYNAFIEISPHPVLLHSIQETIDQESAEAVAVVCARRDSDEASAMRSAAGALHVAGYPIDFAAFYSDGDVVSLPAYPWERERYWLEIAERPAASVQGDPAEHLYEMYWREADGSSAGAIAGPRRFAVVAHPSAGEPLAQHLRAAGHHVAIVPSADELPGVLPATDVVHLLSMHPEAEASLEFDSVARAQSFGAHSVLETVRILADSEPARLCVATAAVLPVDLAAGNVRIQHATIAGLIGAIRREHPELQCRHIDLAGAGPVEIERLAALILRGTVEEVSAIRGNTVYAPRFERATGRAGLPHFKADATYLIAGGLGGVGLELASFMAANGARNLVLTGRRAEPGDAAACLDVIRASGATVRYIPADLTDGPATLRLLETIKSSLPPLRGIVLATAVLDDALVRDTTSARFAPVFASKAAAALNLHEHTADVELDFFALCSSMAVSMTQGGQGSYAAANAFLDAFAAYRRSQGKHAASIQWGVWARMGLANAEGTRRSTTDYIERGVRPLTAASGSAMFHQALQSQSAVLLAAPVSWDRFAGSYDGGQLPRAFAALTPRQSRIAEAPPTHSLGDRLASLKPQERKQAVTDHVRTELAAVLKTAAAKIDARKPLGTLGLDSLLSLDLVRRLSSSTGVRLPATIVFNFPTLTALSAELARRMNVLDGESAPVEKPSAAAPTTTPGDIAGLSEEEALMALMAKSGSSNS